MGFPSVSRGCVELRKQERLASEGWAPVQARPSSQPAPLTPLSAGQRKQQLLSCGEDRQRSTWRCWDFHNTRPSDFKLTLAHAQACTLPCMGMGVAWQGLGQEL